MAHTLVKILIINKVVDLISSQYQIQLDDARDAFYKSKTIDLLDDDSTGLYGDSPLYIFSLFEKENSL